MMATSSDRFAVAAPNMFRPGWRGRFDRPHVLSTSELNLLQSLYRTVNESPSKMTFDRRGREA